LKRFFNLRCLDHTQLEQGVIPINFEIFNDAHLHDDIADARLRYQLFLEEGARAGACLDCDVCEPLCPQQIPISEWMPKVHAQLNGPVN
jgi:uncharacterized protein